jgi:hypothetical protein
MPKRSNPGVPSMSAPDSAQTSRPAPVIFGITAELLFGMYGLMTWPALGESGNDGG